MEIIKKLLSNLSLNNLWTGFLTFSGLLGTLIGAYSWYESHTKSPYLSFTVDSVASVLNIQKPLQDLQVYYNGNDIRSIDMDLDIITVTIRNEGTATILQSEYDQLLPIGLKVQNSHILSQPKIINSSSTYISNHLNPKSNNKNAIELNKVILEPGSYATLEMTALIPRNQDLNFESFGKIANQEKIPIFKYDKNKNQEKTLEILFSGGLLVQFLRSIFYGLFFISTCLASIILFYKFTGKIKKNRADKARLYIKSKIEPLLKNTSPEAIRVVLQLLGTSGGDIKKIDNFLELLGRRNEFNEYCHLLEHTHKSIAEINSDRINGAPGLDNKIKEVKQLKTKIVNQFQVMPPLDCVAEKDTTNFRPRDDLPPLIREIMNNIYQSPPPVKFLPIDFDYLIHLVSENNHDPKDK